MNSLRWLTSIIQSLGDDPVVMEMSAAIVQHGWAFTSNCTEDRIRYTHSVGMPLYGQPEVIVFGIPQQVACLLMDPMLQKAADGELTIEPGMRLDWVMAHGYAVEFVEVKDTSAHFDLAALMFSTGEGPVRGVQMLWGDEKNRLPGDDGYDVSSFGLPHMPLLGERLVEPRRDN